MLLKRWYPVGVSLAGAAIFIDSLRYKFTDHPKTQEIFGRLDAWAASLGAPGLFDHTGLFSQYVIGSAELVAATLLLVGLAPGLKRVQLTGAAVGFAVMSGAVNFHLWTPLGIDPNNDGAGLFAAAVALWAATGILLLTHLKELGGLLAGLGRAFVPVHS
jgi:hypothetical protein